MSECSFPVSGTEYKHQHYACSHMGSWILQHAFPVVGPTPTGRHVLISLLVNVTGTFAVVPC
jgi:hypothetical protein